MRTEEEMFQLILTIAEKDDRICCAYLNGSRANPKIKKDRFQDFDIVYVVKEIQPFLEDSNWLNEFGDIAVMQEPNSPAFGWGEGHQSQESYTWLILFKDGNRMDLTLDIQEIAEKRYLSDTLTVKLLDKGNLLPDIPPTTDETHWIKKPTQAEFLGCCNEFWWCLNNVGKGLARQQIPYVMRMYHEVVHGELDKMLEWSIALSHDFQVTSGMWGKDFQTYLSQETYQGYLQTYATAEVTAIWQAVFTAMRLFSQQAQFVSQGLGFDYNLEEEKNMFDYLRGLKAFEEKQSHPFNIMKEGEINEK